MAILNPPVGRIRQVGIRIQQLEDILMGNAKITLSEQSKIHNELRTLREEQNSLEVRTRNNLSAIGTR
jgi:hypothetical protein